MKNSGPEPTHATAPLLMVGQASGGILLKVTPPASSVPWISANGGPKEAWKDSTPRSLRILKYYCTSLDEGATENHTSPTGFRSS